MTVTSTAAWSSSDPTIAAVHATPGTYGNVDGIKAGTATISATLDGVVKSVTFTVLPIKLLEAGVPDAPPGSATAASIDGQGRSNVSVAHSFSGVLFGTTPLLNAWSRQPPGDWSAKTRVNSAVTDDKPTLPILSTNAAGTTTMAWSGRFGVFAARYSPATGWQAARAIVSGTTNFNSFASSIRLATDTSGNSVAVWVEASSNQAFSSRFRVDTDAWTTPVVVSGCFRGLHQGPIAFAMNPAGQGVMACEGADFSMPGWTVSAIAYDPIAGWSPATLLHRTTSFSRPDVAISGTGEAFVAGADSSADGVYVSRYVPGTGWLAGESIADGSNDPFGPRVAVNDAGDAVVVWSRRLDDLVSGRRFTRATGWDPALAMTAHGFGTPAVLQPFIAGDGRILVTWDSGDAVIGMRSFRPGTGWSAEGRYAQMGHKGPVYDVVFAFNAAGNGVAVWSEGADTYDDQGISHRSYFYFADSSLRY